MKGVLSFEEKTPFPGIPTVREIGHPDLAVLATERIIGTVPGTPKAIANGLEQAIIKGGNEASIQAWAKKGKRALNPLSATDRKCPGLC